MARIAILGCRGIPNHYGGFEELAEHLAPYLQSKGHEVFVYQTHNHPYQNSEYKGVRLIQKFNPEQWLGGLGQLIYDLLCWLHVRKLKPDVLLQLGYTSAVFYPFFPKKVKVVTNMDGLEWQREKYGKWAKKFLLWCERKGMMHSDIAVADHPEIKAHLERRYKKKCVYIAYGWDAPADISRKSLYKMGLHPGNYDLVIARIEPENQIELMIQAHLQAATNRPLVIVGSMETPFGKELLVQYGNNPRLKFLGGLFERTETELLRRNCTYYLHGHSAGGTNPSLLQALASGCKILAYGNEFNTYVAQENAWYFKNTEELVSLLKKDPETFSLVERIAEEYAWEKIGMQYEEVLTSDFFEINER